MKEEYWSKRELEQIYVNVFINEEEVYVKKLDAIRKQKIYILIGINLKGYKEVIGIIIPEEETTGYWIGELNKIKYRGVEHIFMVSMINNKWLKRVFKMVYQNVIYTPSMIEIYNKTQNYISRKEHRIVIQEINRIYKAETIEEAKEKYYNLEEVYKDNKLIMYIIGKYKKEILEMLMKNTKAGKTTYYEVDKMLNELKKKMVQKLINAEFDEHMKYEKGSHEEKKDTNRRNGKGTTKTIKTTNGE